MADSTPTKPKSVLAERYQVPSEQLTDGEVTLRRWHLPDAPALLAAASASLPELQRWMPWAAHGYTLDDATSFLRVAVADWDAGRGYNYAVVVDGRVLGSFGLMEPASGAVGVGMGYWLATEATGRGLATRAAGMLTRAAFECGAELVQIWHRVENARSRAIPERLEYRFVGEREDLQISERGAMGLWQKDKPEA
ncbi:acetyltransferase [Cordyceps fumosorosea ARSEF 2679]|uniref:Acetyltransferase n=1 Tax=Cordyceps fumosorosea (strain ARSEF 2679) TaxID=1081104 RepID=A0A167MQH3_CORFA|nr:acetyltransferase [Cordyceps fumosorosea ARSEF 2679]OAA54646.1 acetyltransferase [Cordyceps fumosorosea ARSEF 2679]